MVGNRFTDVAIEALSDSRSQNVHLSLVVGGKHETLTDYEEFLLSSSTDDLPDDQQLLGGPMFYTSGTTGRPKGVRGRCRVGDYTN